MSRSEPADRVARPQPASETELLRSEHDVAGGVRPDPTRIWRIGIFSYGLPLTGAKRGGIERAAHDFAQGFACRGHRVTVWSYDPAPAGAAYEVRQPPCGRFVTSWLGRRLAMGYLGNLLVLAVPWQGCDVIVAMGDSLLLPLLRKPLVRVMHGSALGEALSAKTPWRFLGQMGVFAGELLTGLTQRGCVAVSQNTLRYNPFIKRVIPNGVDLQRFKPNYEIKSTVPAIICVGSLEGRKRGRMLIEWFSQLVKPRHPQAVLWFVGERGVPCDGVEYYLGISDEQLVSLYQRAWVYASPSSYEGFGLPYVEAMACATAVLASPNPGSREVLADGDYGILADDADFAIRLIELLDNRRRREELAAEGLTRAAYYSMDRMLDQYEALIVELIDERR